MEDESPPSTENVITPEMQREIFDMFDSDGSGSIDMSELTDAMKLLGVKCSKVSARKVFAMIDTSNNGLVEWEEFETFFSKVQTPEDMKKLLAETNKKFLDYKQMVDSDTSFGKRFHVPASVPSQQLEGHTDSVEDVTWISSTEMLSASLDRTLRIWDLAGGNKNLSDWDSLENKTDGKHSSRLVGSAHAGIYCLSAAPDGSLAVTGLGCRDENVCVWDLENCECLSKFSDHDYSVYCCDLTSSKRHCISGDQDGMLVLHDIETQQMLCESAAHEGVINSCSYSEDEQTHCTASADGTVQVRCFRTPTTSKPVLIIEEAAAAGSVAQALWRDQNRILSCGEDYCIKLWDIRNIKHGPIVQYLGHTSPVRAITLSPDKKFLASGSNLGAVRVWPVDEIDDVEKELDSAGIRIEQLERRREKVEALAEEGEASMTPDELVSMLEELKHLYEHAEWLADMRDERKSMGCIQARLECGDHSLSVNRLNWTTGEDGKEQLVSVSQDQTLLLSCFPSLNPKEFVKFKDIGGGGEES